MKKDKSSVTWEKHRLDQAMTLSEHAITSGYGYSTLKQMRLPLINGKIPHTDFRRILRRRQDALEAERFPVLDHPSALSESHPPPLSVDKFRSPRGSA